MYVCVCLCAFCNVKSGARPASLSVVSHFREVGMKQEVSL